MGDQRINAGHLLAALGATVLLASLFADWYGANGEQLSGWASFEAVDVVLAIAALVALWVVLPLGSAAERSLRRLPILRSAVLPLAGLALLLVVANLLGRPPIARGAELEAGALLALGGSLALLAGLLIAESRFSVVIRVVPRGEATAGRAAPTETVTTPVSERGTASPAPEEAETRPHEKG